MLVYGDIEHTDTAANVRVSISNLLARAAALPHGRARQEMLVTALIRAGELVQGLLDQDFETTGMDDLSEIAEAGGRVLLALAKVAGGAVSDDWKHWLDMLDSEEPVRMRQPEGYAFYGLYPESYAQAARRSGLGPGTVIIGLRSIGTSLSAVVAAALDAAPPVTVRPTGHPFARELRLSDRLKARLLADRDADFAIVDEGPGLSGSSFGCVADWLEAHGVVRDRIHFFPGHGGDLGPQASAAHRARWRERPRHVATMDEMLDLRRGLSDLIGCAITSVEDISGGRWRGQAPLPSDAQLEKRKFLMRAGDRAWLARFAGLGGIADAKAARGRVLADAGFTPPVVGTVHGFLVEEWVEGRPSTRADRRRLIDHIGHYLTFRARHLPAPEHGASLDALREMAVYNTRQAVDLDAAPFLDRLKLETRRLRRIDSDNRLHAWEWLVTEDGRILKTDALDHNAAHDLVGAQDMAWDIAGASVEFGLTEAERRRLIDVLAREAGYDPDPDVLSAFELFYLAFQAGLWTNAANASSRVDRERNLSQVKRYADRLWSLVDASTPPPSALRLMVPLPASGEE